MAHSKCNLNYKVPKEVPIIIHNATYDTHFIINQLAIEFKGELNCIGDNMEKYITFSVPIKKKCDIDNTSGIFNSIEWKSCIEKIKINSEYCFVGLKNNKLIYKCIECKEEWKRPLSKLIENFPSIYQFCNGNLNKFVLLLRKGVYPYEYLNSWEKFSETVLQPKKAFYSNLNLEDISNEDYLHA